LASVGRLADCRATGGGLELSCEHDGGHGSFLCGWVIGGWVIAGGGEQVFSPRLPP
jgi:hypothetical protein